MSLELFHPVIQDWFRSRFATLTDPQRAGWPAIANGGHTLISAPTGSGKTLTAFLAIIDRLLREGLEGRLADEMRVVYVSPLRALSNDMHKNLEQPLREILEEVDRQGLFAPPICVGLRTGDTPSHRRAALVKRPPHILVTTPESLYLMLTARKSRETLRSVDTLIVDEIHALVRDKRGSHLSLTVERLEALVQRPLQRIGISATQKPIERVGEFLVGGSGAGVERPEPGDSQADRTASPATLETRNSTLDIINVGHQRDLNLGIEVPPSDLSAVCSHEQWGEVNERLVELINAHRSTLIFVNTRKLAERLTFQLSELLGEEAVGAHHGSLAADIRLGTEQKLKEGRLKAVVATASLELGIDVGYIDLVVQIGSPRSIATFLQRIGRSGHALGLTPKGRLFAMTRDELLECMALVRAIKDGRLDAVPIPVAPLDVLAQQIVAEVAAQEWNVDELFALVRRAAPYRNLPREHFDSLLEFLSEGLTSTSGRGQAFLHYDRVNQRLRPRKNARLVAVSNGGAIGEVDTFRVVAEPDMTVVGSVDEEFAVESNAGDIFLLGNTSWRIRGPRGSDLIVSDAHGAPPTIPFWRGEAPGRTVELSAEVSVLRKDLFQRIQTALASKADSPAHESDAAELVDWLTSETHCPEHAARQALHYVAAQQAAVATVPTQTQVVFERFFDESGGMQLVVHAPFGSRINRAWGLAMRKRFCRSFDFELQATADDDGFILSLGPQHSFPIESLFPMLRTDNVRGLLEQALLAVPMFRLRWRWNVTRALQVERMRSGKKVPPALQRFRSEDLLTAVFPKLTGCQEEHTGDHIIPDHPLVQQTMHDCLHEALDLDGLIETLGRVERGEITFVARDTREPSPFAYELLNANPYAFLDGGEVQERRARMAATQRTFTLESVRDLGHLDAGAIEQVIAEAQPLVRDADELHDVLLSRLLLPVRGPSNDARHAVPESILLTDSWRGLFNSLVQQGRATEVQYGDGRRGWVAAERWPAIETLFPDAHPQPPVTVPPGVQRVWESTEARVALVRGLMETAGPVTAEEIAEQTGITLSQASAALEALEGEGIVLRGKFRDAPASDDLSSEAAPDRPIEWCHRRLLSRIHRLTVSGLRREIEPVDVPAYLRFLLASHGLGKGMARDGVNGLYEVIGQLQGMDIPAAAWEKHILPQRVEGYRREWLDELSMTGELGWGRLDPPPRNAEKGRPMASLTRSAPLSLYLREDLPWLLAGAKPINPATLSDSAQQIVELLSQRGAMFATDLLAAAQMVPAQLDDVLGELVSRGVVTSDGFAGLRSLIRQTGNADIDSSRRSARLVRRRRSSATTGRWSLWRTASTPDLDDREQRREWVEHWAWQLLRRWGVVFRDLLIRESGAPSWWELTQVYRRLEARGEIRGGRFVVGVGGEQYATSEAVQALRSLRSRQATSEPAIIVLSAADPLNLVGIVTRDARVPSLTSNRVVYADGIPVADRQAERVTWYDACPDSIRPSVEAALSQAPVVNSAPAGSTKPDEPPSEEPVDHHAQRFGRPRRPPVQRPKFPRPIIS